MRKYQIVEYDKDYRTVADTFVMEFENLEQAEEWCRNKSWSGYTYYAKDIDEMD